MVQLEEEPDPELILQSDEFKMDLVVMERVVLENIYQPELAAYRHLAVLQGNTHRSCSVIADIEVLCRKMTELYEDSACIVL